MNTSHDGRSDDIRKRLTGPIPSVRIPFTRSGEIDLPGLDAYVEASLATDPSAVMITYGDSHLHVLSDQETELVTDRVIRTVAGRSMVIAADRSWWTGQSVAFATWCREAGADMVMVLPPDWTLSGLADGLVGHYAAVAAELPTVLLSCFFAPRSVADTLAVVRRIRDTVPGVVAIKDDIGGEHGRRIACEVADRWAVLAGGSKRLQLFLQPYGSLAYLSTLAVFRPDLATRYWQLAEAGDTGEAVRFITRTDTPMYDLLATCPGGFDAGLHGWMELAGLGRRWRRSPYHSLTDAELDGLADGLTQLGLLPDHP